MSGATITRPAGPGGAASHAWPPIPFARLTAVELRKQLDTRAGVWLMVVIVLVNAALIALTLVASAPEDLTWQELTGAASIGQLLLLPLVGVLAATGEWSQRTALTTFVLEPRRMRVTLAKLASSVALGLVVMAGALAVAAALNVLGMTLRDGDGSWSMDAGVVGGNTLALVILVVQGVAFGLALLSTPMAIVAYLALPTAWSVLGLLVTGLRAPAEWLDVNATLMPLMAGEMAGDDWARLGVSVAAWVGVPLAIGLWRTGRREVS
ncbi:ABC transporter permease [Cellulomonas cellasea]|uniref:ABC transporter permease n=1 Tax=Cellulomonas cellasea TaxID=43670 RepID=UPI0025A4B358|nr:ABC transporter permease [Cellulomonas cellasea]MDM8083981.1 ABC transporter permease [Cellulomonas cellasea]